MRNFGGRLRNIAFYSYDPLSSDLETGAGHYLPPNMDAKFFAFFSESGIMGKSLKLDVEDKDLHKLVGVELDTPNAAKSLKKKRDRYQKERKQYRIGTESDEKTIKQCILSQEEFKSLEAHSKEAGEKY